MKNGNARIFLSPEDVIDEKFLEALEGGICRIVNNTKVEEDVTLAFGLLIESPQEEKKPEPKHTLWNLFGLIKSN